MEFNVPSAAEANPSAVQSSEGNSTAKNCSMVPSSPSPHHLGREVVGVHSVTPHSSGLWSAVHLWRHWEHKAGVTWAVLAEEMLRLRWEILDLGTFCYCCSTCCTCCASALDGIWDNHGMDTVLGWMMLSFQGSLSVSVQIHEINLARFHHPHWTGGNDLVFKLHKGVGAKIPDSGWTLQDAEVRRFPVLPDLLNRSVPRNFSQIFPFLMKIPLCAQRKAEFLELENGPLCVFLLGISYSGQPCCGAGIP